MCRTLIWAGLCFFLGETWDKLNANYNLGSNAYKKAEAAEIEYDAEAYWMAIQFDELTYSIFFGSLKELDHHNSIPIRKCEQGSIGMCLVKDKRHYFDFGFFGNLKDGVET